MTKKSNESKRPTHTIWQVMGEGEKARWIPIGAAWMHKDLKGANLKFDSFPMNGRIVVRAISEQDDAAQASTTQTEGGE